jgi:phosphoglycolate phosphatase
MVKTILFDFDGTIAETVAAGVAAFNGLAREYGFVEITDENAEILRSKGPRAARKALEVPLVRVPLVLRTLRAGVRSILPTLEPVPGIRSAISALKERGFHLGIVTSNSAENVQGFLENNAMADGFDYLEAGAGIFRKAKAIKKALSRNDVDPGETVFVGDEIRDIEAARKNNLITVAVTWGLNSREGLADAKPDFMIETPEALLELFSEE